MVKLLSSRLIRHSFDYSAKETKMFLYLTFDPTQTKKASLSDPSALIAHLKRSFGTFSIPVFLPLTFESVSEYPWSRKKKKTPILWESSNRENKSSISMSVFEFLWKNARLTSNIFFWPGTNKQTDKPISIYASHFGNIFSVYTPPPFSRGRNLCLFVSHESKKHFVYTYTFVLMTDQTQMRAGSGAIKMVLSNSEVKKISSTRSSKSIICIKCEIYRTFPKSLVKKNFFKIA